MSKPKKYNDRAHTNLYMEAALLEDIRKYALHRSMTVNDLILDILKRELSDEYFGR